MNEKEMLEKIRELEAAAMDNAKSWAPTWAKIVIAVLIIAAIAAGGWGLYKHMEADKVKPSTQITLHKPDPMTADVAAKQGTAIVVQPIVQPQQQGTMFQIVKKGTQVVAVVDGKEQVLPLPAGIKELKVGENGMVEVVETSTVRIDQTAELNARLKAAREIDRLEYERDKQKALDELNRKKEREKIGTGLGSFAAGVLTGKLMK